MAMRLSQPYIELTSDRPIYLWLSIVAYFFVQLELRREIAFCWEMCS